MIEKQIAELTELLNQVEMALGRVSEYVLGPRAELAMEKSEGTGLLAELARITQRAMTIADMARALDEVCTGGGNIAKRGM